MTLYVKRFTHKTPGAALLLAQGFIEGIAWMKEPYISVKNVIQESEEQYAITIEDKSEDEDDENDNNINNNVIALNDVDADASEIAKILREKRPPAEEFLLEYKDILSSPVDVDPCE